MADVKVSALPPAQAGTEADLGLVVQSGESRKQTRTQLRTAMVSAWASFIRTFLTSASQEDARGAIGAIGAASPSLTGAPTATTATAGDNSTRIATTAFVTTANALKAPLASPALTGAPTAPTQTLGDNTTKLATMEALRASILGTVVDTAGLPTGTVLEFTPGANGDCLRLADGTQITAKLLAIGSTGFVASGSVFITSASQGGGAYTKPFVGTPKGFVSVRGGSGLVWHTIQTEATATTWPLFFMMSSTNTTTSTSATLFCFGRWK